MPRSLALLAVLLVLLLAACASRASVGPVQNVTEQVALGSANSVHADVQLDAGDLNLSSQASGLMDANFTYNVAAWKPQISYAVSGQQGSLSVKQPDVNGGGVPTGDVRYEWDLHFNNDVPLELRVKLGDGTSDLNLGDLAVTRLDVEMGAGELDLDMLGEWERSLSASIKGGAGDLTVRLPRGVGVRVESDAVIGSADASGFLRDGDAYVNDAYGKTAVTLSLDIKAGVGQIRLELGGS